uniref:HSF-type DNA-binding domain-containing protein n=1 Tax=Trichobilharzia regenti TaxID=157069 RepID=A0AA85JA98_TRIRE|nr:unnamed protein product [Trichobilharzia regenti]
MYTLPTAPSLQSIPAFLTKLKLLVDNEETNDLIYWDPLGASFHIRDGNRLAKELLPLYFKHNNLSSFIRQLNMYGFRKINRVDPTLPMKADTEDMEFSHPYFIRNKESLLPQIHRRASNMGSPVLSSRNQNWGVRIPYTQTNPGVNGTINLSSPQRPITAADFMRLAETVRHLHCNQESLTQQISVLKSENQLLYRELSDLREHHDKQSQLIQTLFTFLSAFAKEGRSASVCIGQSKRKALPSIASSSSKFQNKGLKLNLPQGFQLDRSSVQPFQFVQTADLIGPAHKRPKFDVRTLSATIGNGNTNTNMNGQISDIGSVVQILPTNLQLTPVSLRSDGRYVYSLTGSAPEYGGNTQSLVNTVPGKVQEVPIYYVTKLDNNGVVCQAGGEEVPASLPADNVNNVGENVDTSILELNWPCNRSATPCSQADPNTLSDVLSAKLNAETDDSICDLFLNCDSQTDAEVMPGRQQSFTESSPLKYSKFDLNSDNLGNKKKTQRNRSKVVAGTPDCISAFADSDSSFVSANLQDIDSLPWEKDQEGGFDFSLDECTIPLENNSPLGIDQTQTENSNSSSSGFNISSEIVPLEAAGLKACDDVFQFLRSEGRSKTRSTAALTTNTTTTTTSTKTTVPVTSPANKTAEEDIFGLDLTFNPSAPTTWKSKLSADNRLTISAYPKVKRKSKSSDLKCVSGFQMILLSSWCCWFIAHR